MRVTLNLLPTAPPDDPKLLGAYMLQVLSDLAMQLSALSNILNGQLTFGDTTSGSIDNMSGAMLAVTTHATPGTEFAVAHNLGVIPSGFLTLIPPQSGVLNKGATAWTTSNLYLTCTGSSQAITIFVCIPPQTVL